MRVPSTAYSSLCRVLRNVWRQQQAGHHYTISLTATSSIVKTSLHRVGVMVADAYPFGRNNFQVGLWQKGKLLEAWTTDLEADYYHSDLKS